MLDTNMDKVRIFDETGWYTFIDQLVTSGVGDESIPDMPEEFPVTVFWATRDRPFHATDGLDYAIVPGVFGT
jgi:hypothetical protein